MLRRTGYMMSRPIADNVGHGGPNVRSRNDSPTISMRSTLALTLASSRLFGETRAADMKLREQ
jgi:hypothetical protein